MKRVVPRWEAMRYDGTNGADVCALMTPPAELVSEEGEVLVYSVQGFERAVKAGDYVLRESTEDPWGMVLSAEEYARRYVELPE